MDLKLKDVAKLLKLSDKTIYRWVQAGKIPYYRINHQYRFRKEEILQWSECIPETSVKTTPARKEEREASFPVSLYNAVNNGGIYYNIEGENITDALTNAVELINIPPGLEKKELLTLLLKREAMASTAVGGGIAFPHPRNQIVNDPAAESISICFLHSPIEGIAMDKDAVHTLFIILSSTQERHLKLLSSLYFICRQNNFLHLMKNCALRSDIINYIKQVPK